MSKANDVVGQVRREALREVLAFRVADLTRQVTVDDEDDVRQAVADPDHDLHRAIADRDRVLSADNAALAQIEQRWGANPLR